MNRLGSLELIEFHDESVAQLANAIDEKPAFRRYYERLDRSDKYIVCRISVNHDCAMNDHTQFYTFAKDRNACSAGDLRVSFHQIVSPDPVHFAAQQVPNPHHKGQFLLRPWNIFSETHLKSTEWDDNPSKKTKDVSEWRAYNLWVSIPDLILGQVTSKEIEEVIDIKSSGVKGQKVDLLKQFFDDQKQNLNFVKKWRLIWTKILIGKLVIFFYLYNNAMEYFIDHRLVMAKAMRNAFGQRLGEAIGDETNQIWLYLLLGTWISIALQLVVTAAAREYKDHWLSSIVCYAIGLPLLVSFVLTFAALHKPSLIPAAII